jgi:dephospho-CoA kinase
MKRILLTGMSGTGKSTVIAALGALGYKAVDADYGWCTTAPDGEWLWHEGRVDQLLSTEDADVLFFGGCASNQGKFRHRFDHIILLSAPLDVMLERLRTRTNNSFGKRDDERDRVLANHANVEPLLRASSSAEVYTARALSEIVEDILRLAGVSSASLPLHR